MNKDDINFMNTNARSLCPKIQSLIDSFSELQLTFATITETWLADGDGLDQDLEDLTLGSGISLICKNRSRNHRGVAHGGVALAYRADAVTFKEVVIPNPDSFEVLVTIGNMRGHSRKIVVISCYIPPNYLTNRGKTCLEYISNTVIEVKRLSLIHI